LFALSTCPSLNVTCCAAAPLNNAATNAAAIAIVLASFIMMLSPGFRRSGRLPHSRSPKTLRST
jgi:hypothetical protein